MSGIDNLRGGEKNILSSDQVRLILTDNYISPTSWIINNILSREFYREGDLLIAIWEWCKGFCKKKEWPFICSRIEKCNNYNNALRYKLSTARNQDSYIQWLNDWENTDWM